MARAPPPEARLEPNDGFAAEVAVAKLFEHLRDDVRELEKALNELERRGWARTKTSDTALPARRQTVPDRRQPQFQK